MALSKRLFTLSSFVEKGSVVADIGCDHGLLAIELIQSGTCRHVYACDLRVGPLQRAQEAVEKANLQNSITTLLRDGMHDLPEGIDTVVIAGMGFDTIKMILEAQLDHLTDYKRFIIQSNKHVEQLRRWISEHNFTILEGTIVEEDHFYQIVVFNCDYHKAYDEDEILFGCDLMNHPLFDTYWMHQSEKLKFALAQMPERHENYLVLSTLLQRIEHKLKEKSSTCD